LASMQKVKPLADDVSEMERSERRARDLAQVIEQSGEAVIVKDLNAVVTYWNREAASLYGFSAEEAIGQPLRKLHAAELSETDYGRLLERVRAGRSTSSVTERRKKSGEIIRVSLKTTPLLDSQGTLIGEITIARDVTAMYEKEADLRRAQETLQMRMAAIREANRNLARQIAARREADAAMRRNHQELEATVRQLE